MASSLSDKAIFIYDTFFSADITQGQLDSQIKQSSLFRLAFEEVVSYPNLLEQMKAHDRYDEIIGIGTEAYDMIATNETREENSQLEVSTYIKITDPDLTQLEFDAFLGTVSGHIGFGAIINNPKTAYDIAGNQNAVNLITGSSKAIQALLNAPNGLAAFGKDPVASARIFTTDAIFKQLRQATRFNQYDRLPNTLSGTSYEVVKSGPKYFAIRDNVAKAYASDNMYDWVEITAPNGQNFNNHPMGNGIAYDNITGNWFFLTREHGAPYYTSDFQLWTKVGGSFGASYPRSILNWNGGVYFTAYNASNQWDTYKVPLGQQTPAAQSIKKSSWQHNYIYMAQPDRDDHPYLVAHNGDFNITFINQEHDMNARCKTTASGGAGSTIHVRDSATNNYRGSRTISYANGYFFNTFYYNQSGATRIGIDKITLDEEAFNYKDGHYLQTINKKVFYWYSYDTTDYSKVIYKNGVYIQTVPGGYATSLNGVVWDKILFDVTYSFQITGADERGFIGFVPGTNFVLTSYDAEQQVDVVATTTTTTEAVTENLPEGLTELECLIDTTEASVVEYNGKKMVFNDKDYYENTNYVVTNGQYKILNVPENYPIAVLNYGKADKITYTGLPTKKHFIKTRGTDADHSYDFFYGDVTINVKDNFETVSLYYYKKPTEQGYLGMEKILVHQDYLTAEGTTAADTTSKVSDTTIYAASVRNFDCVGNEALEQTDLTTIPPLTTTTTTATPVYTKIILPTTTTTTAAPDLGDENYTSTVRLDSSSQYSITIVNNELLIQGGPISTATTFASYATANQRVVLDVGIYTISVEDDNPIAFEGATNSAFFGPQHSNISYSGDYYKRSIKSINGTPYYFFHGEVILIVDEPFSTISLYAFNSSVGYGGAQNCISWDHDTTTTTTAAPTTTTTTDSVVTYTRCLDESVDVTFNSGQLEFDGFAYESNVKIGMNNGTYILRNVPQSNPIGFYNYGKWSKFSYTGSPMKSISHEGEDGHQYQYYYGDVTVTVSGDFGVISYDTNTDGYAGGENNLIYDTTCALAVQPTTTTTTLAVTTTTIPNSIITTLPPTTTTTAAPTTTTTTATPTVAEYCLVSGNTGNVVSFSGGNYVFNGNSGLYGMTTGTYILKNVSASHPIAFQNFGKTNVVTYSGQYSQGTKIAQDGNSYPYYYGDVTVTVAGDFNFLSYECFYHGYMGGQNNIIYDNTTCS
jgi:hypothetical protein